MNEPVLGSLRSVGSCVFYSFIALTGWEDRVMKGAEPKGDIWRWDLHLSSAAFLSPSFACLLPSWALKCAMNHG